MTSPFRPAALAVGLLFAASVVGWAADPPPKPTADEAKQRLKGRDRLWDEARKLAAEGKVEDALDAAGKMIAIEREVLGPDHRDVQSSLKFIAGLHRRAGDWDAAKRAAGEFAALTAKLDGEKSWQTTDARLYVAQVERLATMTSDQRKRAAEAADFENRAVALAKQGKLDDALDAAKKCRDAFQDVFGTDGPEYAGILNYLGYLHSQRGEYGQAEVLHTQCLALRKKLLGEFHPDCALSLSNIGFVHLGRKDFAKAVPLFVRAAEVRAKALGETSADHVESLLSLASAYRNQGDFDRAMQTLIRAVQLTEKRVGDKDPAYARVTNQAGILMYQEKKYDDAEKAFREARGVWAAALGKDHPDVRTCDENLLAVYEKLLEQARGNTPAGQLPADADGLVQSLPVYVKVARLQDELGNAAKAKEARATALAIQERLRGLPPADPVRPVTQVGHTGTVGAVTYSKDGRLLASADDGAVVVWDAASGREVRRLPRGARAVAFSPDGQRLVTSGYKVALLWDVATGKSLFGYEGHADSVHGVAFSPDGKWLATCGKDKTARLWEAATGREVRRFEGHAGAVQAVSFSAKGDRLLTAGEDKTARVWEVASGQELHRLEGHTLGLTSAVFSPNGLRVVTGGADATIRVWDVAANKQVAAETFGKGQTMVTAAWAADGSRLAFAWDSSVRVLEVATNKTTDYRRYGRIGDPQVIALSADGRSLAAADGNGAKVWSTAAGSGRDLDGLSEAVNALAFAPDGRALVTAGMDKTAWVWGTRGQNTRRMPDGLWADVVTNGKVETVWKGSGKYEGHDGVIQSVAYSPDGKWVLTGGANRLFDLAGETKAEAILWDAAAGRPVRRFLQAKGNISAVAFSPDGATVAVGLHLNTGEQSLKFFDAATGKDVTAPKCDIYQVDAVVFSPDGKYVLATGFDKDGTTTRVWARDTGREVQRWAGYTPGAAFHPDGKTILVRGLKAAAALRAVEGDRELRRYESPFATQAVALSADGLRAAAVGEFGGVVWDAATGHGIARLNGPFGTDLTNLRAAFSPDGRILAVAAGQTTHLLDAKTGKELCRLVGFTDNTWAVVDPEGRYDASNGGDVNGLHWVVGQEPIALSQLKDRYYDPGLLAKHLGVHKEPLRTVAAFTAPKLYPGVDAKTAGTALDVTLSNRGGGIGKVVVLVNGKEATADARPRGADPDAAKLTLKLDLAGDPRLEPGKPNKVEVIAYNAEGYLASRGLVRVIEPEGQAVADPPELWAVVCGVSDYRGDALDLKFAAKDADDFAAAVRVAGDRLFGKDHVHLTALSSTRPANLPNRANLTAALAAAQKAKPGDVLVVYLAGHGVNHGGQDGDFHYLTADAASANLSDPAVRDSTSLSSRDLTELLKRVPAQKQVLVLDTCASGKLLEKLSEKRDVPGSQVRALEQLKDRTGMFVLAGCAADAVSYEATRYGQGLLTHSLLLGMRGAALKDERVDVSNLFGFAVDRVPELARNIGGVQRPVVAAPRGGQSFPIGLVTAADRAGIPLQADRPMLLRCSLQDEDEFKDVLDLGKKVDEALRGAAARGRDAPLVFVDATDLPDAHHLAGRYKTDGDAVTLTGNLFRGKARVGRVTASGSAAKPDEFAAKVAAEVEKVLRSTAP